MVITIVLVLFIVAAYLLKRYDCAYDDVSFIAYYVCASFLIIHIPAILIKGYDYEIFYSKRVAFEITLNEARAKGSHLEVAAILQDVAKWNEKLAEWQYNNTTLFLDQYIDDRIDDLKPIR